MAGGRSARGRTYVLAPLLAFLALLAVAQRAVVASAADGLPPGVPVPGWAKGRWVHFDPTKAPPPRSRPGGRSLSPTTQGGPTTPESSAARPAAPAAGAGPLVEVEEPLSYEGGPVENEPRLVLVFWGEGWNYGEGPALRHKMEVLADGLPGSGYQKILTQYSSFDGPISPGPLIDSPTVETYYDPSAVPADLGHEAFFEEGARAAAVKPPGDTLDTTYAVIPAPGTTYEAGKFCGWHSLVRGPSTTSVEPAAVAAILLKDVPGCKPFEETLSHEYAESVTDPTGVAWGKLSPKPEEIADACAYLGPQPMADGALVAPLWDDSKKACEIEDDDPEPVPIGPYTDQLHEEATDVNAESETLETSLEPCDEEAHYYFEYGTTEAYGSRTAEFTLPATWGDVKATATITGLQHEVPYYWQVVVRTANGTARGAKNSFEVPYDVKVSAGTPEVGTTEATLNGHVDPAGVEATYHFEYGTTEAYGSSTPDVSAGSGTSSVPVSAKLTGLSAGTFYHFRMVASSSRGTTVGADHTFLTYGGEPTAETLLGRVGYDEAGLKGMVDAKGVSTNFYFEYGTTSKYGKHSLEQSVDENFAEEVGAIVRGLTPDITYHFRVVASNSYGTVDGADQTFTTKEEPLVESGTAEAIGYNDATLSGTIDPHETELNYYFEYGTAATYGERTEEARTGSYMQETQYTATVGGLAEGTTYHFRLVAIDPNAPKGEGVIYGADQTFATPVQPTVQTGSATTVGAAGATLNGTIHPYGEEVKYFFEYGLTSVYGSSTTEVALGAAGGEAAASRAIAALSPSTTYHYRLVAVYDSVRTYGGDVTFTSAPEPLVEPIKSTPFPQSAPPGSAPPASSTPVSSVSTSKVHKRPSKRFCSRAANRGHKGRARKCSRPTRHPAKHNKLRAGRSH